MHFPKWVTAPVNGKRLSQDMIASNRLAYIVRRLALELDPYGTMQSLAERTGMNASRIGTMITQGRFTQGQAELMEQVVGRSMIKKEHLMYPMDIQETVQEEEL